MSKLYFNKENIGEYTNSEKLAQLKVERGEWGEYGETEDEIVMQGDGSGYCFKADYFNPIENVATAKYEELKAIRDEKEVEDIATPLGVFDYDQKARERINAAICALEVQGDGANISWTLADNTEAIVTANDLKMVIALIAQRSNELHVKYRKYHAQIEEIIENGGTADEINAIVWED